MAYKSIAVCDYCKKESESGKDWISFEVFVQGYTNNKWGPWLFCSKECAIEYLRNGYFDEKKKHFVVDINNE